MKTQHTPGPWHHDEYGHICAGPQIIGKAYQFELDDSDHDELPCIPNARLMAESPELYRKLKKAIQYIGLAACNSDKEFQEKMEFLADVMVSIKRIEDKTFNTKEK